MTGRARKFSHQVSSDQLPQTIFYRLRKLRHWFAWPFVLILFVCARSTPQGFWIGMPFIILGEALRIWSHGHLRKIRRLATSGPYAYLRNPLYLGNFLIGLGFLSIIWHPVIVVIFIVGFFFIFGIAVKGEEERLAARFQGVYKHYAEHVPRFIPRMKPYEERERAAFVAHRVWAHGELITILAVETLLLAIYLRHDLYQNRNALDEPAVVLLVLAAISAVALFYTLAVRRAKGRRKRSS